MLIIRMQVETCTHILTAYTHVASVENPEGRATTSFVDSGDINKLPHDDFVKVANVSRKARNKKKVLFLCLFSLISLDSDLGAA